MTFYREGKVNQLHSEAVYKKNRGTYKKKLQLVVRQPNLSVQKSIKAGSYEVFKVETKNPEYSLLQFE